MILLIFSFLSGRRSLEQHGEKGHNGHRERNWGGSEGRTVQRHRLFEFRNNIAAWFGRIDRRIVRVMTIRICSNRHSGDEQGAQDAFRHGVHVVSEVVLEVDSRATGCSSIVLPHQQWIDVHAFLALKAYLHDS